MRICKYTNSNMLSNTGEFILWNVTHSLQEPFDVSIQCTFISFILSLSQLNNDFIFQNLIIDFFHFYIKNLVNLLIIF